MMTLEKEEIGLVIGGKSIGCHSLDVVRKGLEMGGMILCLTADDRVAFLPQAWSQNMRKASSKTVCGILVGGSVEGISHMIEAFIGDC